MTSALAVDAANSPVVEHTAQHLASVPESIALAPAAHAVYATSASVVEGIAPAPAVSYAAPASAQAAPAHYRGAHCACAKGTQHQHSTLSTNSSAPCSRLMTWVTCVQIGMSALSPLDRLAKNALVSELVRAESVCLNLSAERLRGKCGVVNDGGAIRILRNWLRAFSMCSKCAKGTAQGFRAHLNRPTSRRQC